MRRRRKRKQVPYEPAHYPEREAMRREAVDMSWNAADKAAAVVGVAVFAVVLPVNLVRVYFL